MSNHRNGPRDYVVVMRQKSFSLRRLGLRLIQDTSLELTARLIYTRLFQSEAFYTDFWTRWIIRNHCRSEDICVDVGVYRGDILRTFLKVVDRALVVGFEPNPNNFQFLRNRFPFVQIEPLALGNQIGSTTFVCGFDHPARSQLAHFCSKDKEVNSEGKEVSVPITTLDEYFGAKRNINFIKIDAEGAEFEIIKGGMDILAQSRPIIVFEHRLSQSPGGDDDSRTLFTLLHEDIGLLVSPLGHSGHEINDPETFLEHLNLGTEYFVSSPEQILRPNS